MDDRHDNPAQVIQIGQRASGFLDFEAGVYVDLIADLRFSAGQPHRRAWGSLFDLSHRGRLGVGSKMLEKAQRFQWGWRRVQESNLPDLSVSSR
jgi:hypothetical protein